MDVVSLNIKPVSTNNLYGGKRYKKKEAKEFENTISWLLKIYANSVKLPEQGELELITRFYVSRKFDTSNCLKLLEDCISKHFQINDRRFAGHKISRVKVKPGQEKIKFLIRPYEDKNYEI